MRLTMDAKSLFFNCCQPLPARRLRGRKLIFSGLGALFRTHWWIFGSPPHLDTRAVWWTAPDGSRIATVPAYAKSLINGYGLPILLLARVAALHKAGITRPLFTKLGDFAPVHVPAPDWTPLRGKIARDWVNLPATALRGERLLSTAMIRARRPCEERASSFGKKLTMPRSIIMLLHAELVKSALNRASSGKSRLMLDSSAEVACWQREPTGRRRCDFVERIILACLAITLCLWGQATEAPLWGQEIIWQSKYDGGGDDYLRGIAVDSQGSVYVTGYSFNGANFDCVTVKYDKDGKIVWVRKYDGGNNDAGYGIATDSEGNLYVAGFSSNGTNDDWLVIKYGSKGEVVWQKKYDDGEDWAFGVAVDSQGNVYVTGASCAETSRWVTIKYDSNGEELWHKTCGGFGAGIAVAGEDSVYVTGNSGGATIKYDSAGNLLWQKENQFPPPGWSWGLSFGITVDAQANAYVTGAMASRATNDMDAFLVKYKPNGDVVWRKTYHDVGNDFGYAVAVDGKANAYVVVDFLLIKYNSRGEFLLRKDLREVQPGIRRGCAVACDSEGKIYVGVSSRSNANYDYGIVKLRKQ